ncbi:protein AGENET DOMAIN (AGD)-CONTAINING P1 [Aristolochia californica]|uniref:protein AGENET DOMAIN (AGD)-CONTAINING P1 n=1 Tax=Aristolochia californica TaxID=171875 RepID=UPI0035DE8D87
MEESGTSVFSKGASVEVRSDEPGFVGAWFEASVVRKVKKKQLSVEYAELVEENDVSKPLREIVDLSSVRPRPPPVGAKREFSVGDKVEAFFNDGWWVGDVVRVLDEAIYVVKFLDDEELEMKETDLRARLDWVDGQWVHPSKGNLELKICKGKVVEVCSDEEGFQGAWFTATVIGPAKKNNFLVEYHTLRTDDETRLLREKIHSHHIRPPPPAIKVEKFCILEEVDAFYNDGWWVGVISKVLKGLKYIVYFRQTMEELEFRHSDLRLHQDWINGRWVRASQALRLSD